MPVRTFCRLCRKDVPQENIRAIIGKDGSEELACLSCIEKEGYLLCNGCDYWAPPEYTITKDNGLVYCLDCYNTGEEES